MAISERQQRSLERAAELKAGGSSWESIAIVMHRKIHTVKAWPQFYADEWQQLFAKFEKQFLDEATAELVVALRKQLRVEAGTVSIQAADKLIKYRVSCKKSTPKPTNHVVPTAEERELRFAKELEDEARQDERNRATIGTRLAESECISGDVLPHADGGADAPSADPC